ncbi:MAG: PDZ domain-containing protein [Planctomycetes bacterium]|nr:PDZ domain-containing protein [Planctomycetota bacterium]
MEQRRIVLFLVLSFLVLMLYSTLFPPPRQPDKQLPAENADQVDAQLQADDEEPEIPAKVEEPVGLIQDAEQDAEPAGEVRPEVAEVPLEYVTLGSVDEQSAYRLLVTLTNRGAGVQRVELANSRYRDLHDRGGYLGHLELVADPTGGLLVQVVGGGTPAAAAGLEPGDRIVAAPGKKEASSLNEPADFRTFLAQEKPGATVTLRVARGDAAPINMVATLTRHPLDVIRPEAENVLMRSDKLPADFVDQPSLLFTLEQLGGAKIAKEADEIAGLQLRESHWEILVRKPNSVTFRKRLPGQNVEVLKHYRLEAVPDDQRSDPDYPGYHFTLELEVRNLGQAALDVAYRLDGPNGLPLEGWWYAHKIGRTWSAVGIRDVVARYEGSDPVQFGPANIAEGDIEATRTAAQFRHTFTHFHLDIEPVYVR